MNLAALLTEAESLCKQADAGDASGADRLQEIGAALAAAGYPTEGAEVRQLAGWVRYAGVTGKVRAARARRRVPAQGSLGLEEAG